ncbi:MAG: hypothetical protein K2P40_05670 [Lachnospiraceae bacterium]|jgi:hypothetical protein|nr:hypothetical protein [Lachnospiraceae bacterium]MDE6940412.1 hypothetical protein [Lachnospiraceae bacterium]MDE6992126.1 hypothetical protein [Lachnospiraceae bacterium]MDE7002560.1 hypothetical protein [Lachnospiraceae bacterium]
MDDVALLLAVLGAYLAVFLVIGLVVYVLSSLAHMKALKALGYSKAWMAWIPFVRLYAFADVAADNQESVHMFGSVSVPAVLYKFWWVVWIVLPFVPIIGSLASTVVLVVFLGNCYVKMYARLEGTTEQDQQVIGYLSGLLPIIAIVKFLAGKYNTKY